MSAVVQQPAEYFEFSEFGFDAVLPDTPLRAESRAADHLARQITRWLNNHIASRSCLIAGPRGSGKTTLIEIARRKALDSVPGMRPIMVRLHGPSIVRLPPEIYQLKTGLAENKIPEPGTERYIDLVMDHAIRSLVKNLYQTAAEEFANEFQLLAQQRQNDLRERAAQLRLTLDSAPSPAVLRDFWAAAGVLESGLLFRGQNGPNLRADQGALEIVALATAADAYRTCTGKYKKTQSNQDNRTKENETKTEVSAKGKEFSQALVSLLCGAAVGGAVATSASPLVASVAGAITALIGMIGFSFSASFKRKTESRDEMTFLQDLTVTGLVHRFPLLLRRLEQAGIRPIFVVDELDKLPDAVERLEHFVTNLKFLCADRAFFCFLTDRNYLNQLARRNRASLNNILLTVYTDVLFVLYDPVSFDRYLGLTIRRVPDNAEDRERLRLTLLHSSLMLTFNLRSEIDTLCRALDGGQDPRQPRRLEVQPPELRSERRYQFGALLQIAIQTVLSDPVVKGRIEQDNDFGQIVYDALYYPTRLWRQNVREFDCGQYDLAEGMASLNGEEDPAQADAYAEALRQDDNREFLFAQVRKLLRFIRNRPLLQTSANQAGVASAVVIEEVCRNTPEFLVRVDEDKYKWIYNRFGAPFEPAKIEDIQGAAYAAGFLLDIFAGFLERIPTVPAVEGIIATATPFATSLDSFQNTLNAMAPLIESLL